MGGWGGEVVEACGAPVIHVRKALLLVYQVPGTIQAFHFTKSKQRIFFFNYKTARNMFGLLFEGEKRTEAPSYSRYRSAWLVFFFFLSHDAEKAR